MFEGTLRVRERVHLGDDRDATITGIKVFEHGALIARPVVSAGHIARLSGLRSVHTGDAIGSPPRQVSSVFAPPMFEVGIVAREPAQTAALHTALAQMAEQDPLIDLRQGGPDELFVSLYGEVQREVIEQTLAADFGIEVDFRETTTICIERVRDRGHAVERMRQPTNPWIATVGLEVVPAEPGAGVNLTLDVDLVTIPLYIYKTVDAFRDSMLDYVRGELQRGPSGWVVPDCHVTMVECGYDSPTSSARDFRKLTGQVLQAAVRDAGTIVCEPIQRFQIDAPETSLGGLLRALARLRAAPDEPVVRAGWLVLTGEIAAAAVPALRRQLHGLTHGEGVLDVAFSRYAPR